MPSIPREVELFSNEDLF